MRSIMIGIILGLGCVITAGASSLCLTPDTLLGIHATFHDPIDVPNGVWVEDNYTTHYLPKHFRTLYKNTHTGNAPTRVSGSGQMTQPQLEHIIYNIRTLVNDINVPIYIVDLRLEPHGFMQGIPVRQHDVNFWESFNPGLMHDYERKLFHHLNERWNNGGTFLLFYNIMKKQKERSTRDVITFINMVPSIQKALRKKQAPIAYINAWTNPENVFQTEEDMCVKMGVNYVRMPAIDHHAPSLETLRMFFTWIKTLPKNAWIHFHCAGGRGRTSTFMLLLDMMHRRPHISFEALLAQHHELGSVDFMKQKASSYKSKWARERADLLRALYTQVQNSVSIKQFLTRILSFLSA